MTRPRGRPKGSTKDDSLVGIVRFRCELSQKDVWVRAARAKRMSLSKWLIEAANNAGVK